MSDKTVWVTPSGSNPNDPEDADRARQASSSLGHITEQDESNSAYSGDGPPPAYMSRLILGDEATQVAQSLSVMTISPSQYSPRTGETPISSTPSERQVFQPNRPERLMQPVRRPVQTVQTLDTQPSILRRLADGVLPGRSSNSKQNTAVTPFTDGPGSTCLPRLYSFRRNHGSEKGNKFLQYNTLSAENNNIRHFMSSPILDEGVHHILPLWRSSAAHSSPEVGDIGYFDGSVGHFVPIFNIFHSAQTNLDKGHRLPLHFESLPADLEKTITSSSIDREYADGFRRHFDPGPGRAKIQYVQLSGVKEGILINLNPGNVPQPPVRRILERKFFQQPRAKEYFIAHVAEWYQHAVEIFPDAPIYNGSLFLIEHTIQAAAWSAASFSSTSRVPPEPRIFQLQECREFQDDAVRYELLGPIMAPELSTTEHPGRNSSSVCAIGTLAIVMDKDGWRKNLGGKAESPNPGPIPGDLWERGSLSLSIGSHIASTISSRSGRKDYDPNDLTKYTLLIELIDKPKTVKRRQ